MRKINLKKLAFALTFFASAFLPVASAFADDQPGNPGEPGQIPFDGRAYFVWDCNSKVCYHLFENLKTPEQGINYIKDTEITDQSGNNGKYAFKQEVADWVLPADFVDNTGKILNKWAGKSAKEILAPVWDGGASINAIAFGGGNNSIATNEDWNFQVIIHRNGYKAATIGDNPDDYNYFPSRWEFNYNYYIDISSTSATDPAVVTTYLNEPTIKIKVTDILSMTPLNVNAGAVTVSKSLEGFDVKFNSNYYDHVVFEMKAADGKVYYLMIARTALDIHDNFGPEVTDKDATVIAQVMYPSGSGNGDTYKVIATVVDKNGDKFVSTLNSENAIDRYYDEHEDKWIENNLGKSYDCGKNLKCSQYSVKIGKKMGRYGVYFSVVKNSVSTANVYPGTFSGSNKGALYYLADPANKNFRKVIYE